MVEDHQNLVVGLGNYKEYHIVGLETILSSVYLNHPFKVNIKSGYLTENCQNLKIDIYRFVSASAPSEDFLILIL